MSGYEVRYVVRDGVHIAYTALGDGPLPILLLTDHSMEAMLTESIFRPWIDELRSLGRVLLVDQRGVGSSDPLDRASASTPEDRVDDLLAVLDDLAIPHIACVGIGFGATLCALFAARHPGRVSDLVLYAGFARTLQAADYPYGSSPEDWQERVAEVESDWGRGVNARWLGRWDDETFRESWARPNDGLDDRAARRNVGEVDRRRHARDVRQSLAGNSVRL